jgi:peptidoglycan hydrolase-like protein with peptidoglycan-binding domain
MKNFNNINESEKERIKNLHDSFRNKLISEQEQVATSTERTKLCNQTGKPNCNQLLLNLQVKLNDKKNAGLVEDGLYGPKTYESIKTHLGVDLMTDNPFGDVDNDNKGKTYWVDFPNKGPEERLVQLNINDIEGKIKNGEIKLDSSVWDSENNKYILAKDHVDIKGLFQQNVDGNQEQVVGNQEQGGGNQEGEVLPDNWDSMISQQPN